MELCIKKIYCPTCQRLIKPKEQRNNDDSITILCHLCHGPIRTWDGTRWRLKREAPHPSPKIETAALEKKEPPAKEKKRPKKVSKEK